MARDSLQDVVLDGKVFAWYTGLPFRGLTITQYSTMWNVVLRATNRQGVNVYAMVRVHDPLEGLGQLMEMLSSKGGSRHWHVDKYVR